MRWWYLLGNLIGTEAVPVDREKHPSWHNLVVRACFNVSSCAVRWVFRSSVPPVRRESNQTRPKNRQPSRYRYRRPCHQLCVPEREPGAVALASRAQTMSRNVGLPRRRRSKERRSSMSDASKMETETLLVVSVAIPERLRRTTTTAPNGDR